MLADVLQQFYRYNSWATSRVLDAAENLTAEQLHAPGAAGHGSIRDTLVHMMAAHRGWLSWWDGSMSPAAAYGLKMDPADYPDIAALRAAWREIDQQTEKFVSGLTDADPARNYAADMGNGQSWGMPLWGMMLHVANHGTQHRAEAAAMLTGFGHSPGNLDLLYFLEAPTTKP
ncbi:MAG: DinB family protein [Chloroflexota bacterium]